MQSRIFFWGTVGLISLALLFATPRLTRGNWAQTQDELQATETSEITECTYFANFPQYSTRGPALFEQFISEVTVSQSNLIGYQTQAVAKLLPEITGTSHEWLPNWMPNWLAEQQTFIDFYIFSTLRERGIAPANLSSDAEFLRRITLDLTGRIPSPNEVTAFLSDKDPAKHSRAIDRLIDSPEWVDRWTFWFGDLLKNNVRSTQVVRFNEGRNAFNKFIRDSLTANKPYNKLVADLITATGDSFENGAVNFNVGGIMTMGPPQDTYDKQWVQTATTFLGLKNFDCLLCHNGAGHLHAVNLWGSQVTRAQAWGMAAFFSRSRITRFVRDPNNSFVLQDVNTGSYNLNTNSGNRPVRVPLAGQSATVIPTYLFSGRRAGNSENYRQVLAQELTSDIQFARATVNYIWAHFFGIGIVDPPDAFDLARLDPQNPPPEPWTLQPSHPELLDELARFFIAQNYNLKTLMREIANSRAYQLSSRYEGNWSPAHTRLLARHLVRRLDSEELLDALVKSSGVPNNMRVAGFTDPIPWAMQLPDTQTPGGAVGAFLNTFLRGDRDENPRRKDLSVTQSLDLMNDPLVLQRVRASTANGLLARLLAAPMSDSEFVDALYLNVLSRYPSAAEKTKATTLLLSGNRRAQAEDLLWSLYNKVDFIFNY